MKQENKQLLFSLHPFLFAIFPTLTVLSENLHLLLPTDIVFNASSANVDFNVKSEDGTQLIRTRAEHNIVRLLDYVSINQPTGWVQVDEQQQALAVSGTSVFYSGGGECSKPSVWLYRF